MPYERALSMTSRQPITPDTKVAEVIRRRPEAVEVFLSFGCPDMQAGFFRIMARLMSVRNAARIHRLPLDRLLDELNEVAEKRSDTAAHHRKAT